MRFGRSCRRVSPFNASLFSDTWHDIMTHIQQIWLDSLGDNCIYSARGKNIYGYHPTNPIIFAVYQAAGLREGRRYSFICSKEVLIGTAGAYLYKNQLCLGKEEDCSLLLLINHPENWDILHIIHLFLINTVISTSASPHSAMSLTNSLKSPWHKTASVAAR